MIKRGSQLPTLAMQFVHESMPDIAMVQIAADSQRVTLAYLNANGVAMDVRELSVQENPELAHIVAFTYFDDVWDMDMVLSVIDLVDPEESCGELAPLVPAYLQSLEVAS